MTNTPGISDKGQQQLLLITELIVMYIIMSILKVYNNISSE